MKITYRAFTKFLECGEMKSSFKIIIFLLEDFYLKSQMKFLLNVLLI